MGKTTNLPISVWQTLSRWVKCDQQFNIKQQYRWKKTLELFANFHPAIENAMKRLIKAFSSYACSSDPIPTELIKHQQDKSEGCDSCDWPSNLTQIGFKSLIFQPVWPWNLMDDPKKIVGHLVNSTPSFVPHVKSISVFKQELQSGTKLTTFCPMWPWNLTADLEKQ